MGEGTPGIAIGGIVLTDSSPLAITQVAAPTRPRLMAFIALGHAPVFAADGIRGNHSRIAHRTAASCSPKRKALAITVSPGPMLGQLGNTLASAM